MTMKFQYIIQDLDLIVNGAGDNRYSLYVFKGGERIIDKFRYKTLADLEHGLSQQYWDRQGITSPKVRLLLYGDEGVKYPYMNDRYIYRKDSPPYSYFIEDGGIEPAYTMYVVVEHDIE